VARVEAIEQGRLGDAIDDRLGAGQPDDPTLIALGHLGLFREGLNRLLDALGMGQHGSTEFGELVACRVSLDERLPDPPLQFGQTALHRGLAQPERPPGGQGAAVTGHRQEVAQVVPIEHGPVMHACGPRAQSCGCPGGTGPL
jgi:hypothetical protein